MEKRESGIVMSLLIADCDRRCAANLAIAVKKNEAGERRGRGQVEQTERPRETEGTREERVVQWTKWEGGGEKNKKRGKEREKTGSMRENGIEDPKNLIQQWCLHSLLVCTIASEYLLMEQKAKEGKFNYYKSPTVCFGMCQLVNYLGWLWTTLNHQFIS